MGIQTDKEQVPGLLVYDTDRTLGICRHVALDKPQRGRLSRCLVSNPYSSISSDDE